MCAKKNKIERSNVGVPPPSMKKNAIEIDAVYPLFEKSYWLIALTILVISFLLYFKTTSYEYVLDDQIVITDNKFTKNGFSGIKDLLTTESMTGYFGEQKNLVQGNRYRPLSLVTFAIEFGIFGKLNPHFSHFINILLYALSGILLFLILSKFLPEKLWRGLPLLAATSALIFTVHPIHVEAVANIKGRDEILALLLSLSALYSAIRYRYHQKTLWALMSGVALFLALLAKENSITFVAVIPLTLYFIKPVKSTAIFKVIGVLLVSTFAYLLLRFSVAGVPNFSEKIVDLMNNPFLNMHKGEKMATILYTLLIYIKLLFIPYPLTHDYYPYAIPIMNFGKWQVWVSIVLYASMLIYAIRSLKTKSIFSYSILYYLLTLTIVSNVVINLGTFMNDRFIYMASVGFCLFLVYAIRNIVDRYFKENNIAFIAISFVPILIFSFLSIIRVPDWKDAMALNRSAMKVSSNSARANSFMATALYNEYLAENSGTRKKELIEEASPYAIKAIEIYPTYYNGNIMLAGVAAERYKMNGNLDSLLSSFLKIIDRRPDVAYLTEYLKYLNSNGGEVSKLENFYLRAADMLLKKRNIDGVKWSLHYLNLAYEVNPNSKAINLALGRAYETFGDRVKSAQFNARAATLQ